MDNHGERDARLDAAMRQCMADLAAAQWAFSNLNNTLREVRMLLEVAEARRRADLDDRQRRAKRAAGLSELRGRPKQTRSGDIADESEQETA